MPNTEKDDFVYLDHIREAGERAISYLRHRNRRAFDTEPLLQDAVVHRLQVVGEAASKVSLPFRQIHPEIPWAAIISMRHRIVHDYLNVDLDIVWDTVHRDLPEILSLLRQAEHQHGAEP